MTIDFAGKIAVITGGGTGMGRELARQLVAEGCSVAMCDVSADNMAETRRLCLESAPQGTQVDCYVADVSIEDQMMAWADVVRKTFDTDRIHLLFNNAGVAGGGSFVAGDRASWERTFNICFYGVVHGVRAFLPLLMNAERGHIVNTSSVNGFYASIGPETSHTAYAAAKFAVKGFTESLITDLRLNAPHISAAVVMPGHIGTEIAGNSMAINPGTRDFRTMLSRQGLDTASMDDAQLAMVVNAGFRDSAPTSAAQAATIILDAVKAGQWRILVGDDARILDEMVRADPEGAYAPAFHERWVATRSA
ncbi:SDR family NAD(P)-dependent oxidoreductase [Polymorphobacter arshaanensis]|uniref:SDR family NAD(P)-dependent oxidoreductase n=1 Tax=Glacieibacterium arshaanense TaxID=2511025 RepID=A0A4Y9EQX6_9SPHN|nr:SDR family NAD(P)-dependent oxidoreductase [Polymorphobacter arshaanensis]TFU05669.1 SDR family NAD(P)-dependent oxidoreductase [Polymorphobacter arshaanensis]